MMRNASCFVILFLVNDYLQFLKEASKSNSLLVWQSLSNLSIEIIFYLACKCTPKKLTQWHPKVIPSDVKQVLFGQSIHPFRATALQ